MLKKEKFSRRSLIKKVKTMKHDKDTNKSPVRNHVWIEGRGLVRIEKRAF